MDRDKLERELAEAFGGTGAERRVVSRQAQDLADSGQYRTDSGHELTADVVVENMADADEEGVVERWNWWLGSLELAYADYERFQVRQWAVEDTE
ncbi:MAG: hypothetical protein ABEJ06_00995 [Haloarculaceae archaeon]